MAEHRESRLEQQVRLILEQQCSRIGRDIAEACPAGTGFALFLFDFGEGGNMAYVSNAQREDMIEAVREWLARQEKRS